MNSNFKQDKCKKKAVNLIQFSRTNSSCMYLKLLFLRNLILVHCVQNLKATTLFIILVNTLHVSQNMRIIQFDENSIWKE